MSSSPSDKAFVCKTNIGSLILPEDSMSFGKPERSRIPDFKGKGKKLLKRAGVKQARLDWRKKGEDAPKKRRYHKYYN